MSYRPATAAPASGIYWCTVCKRPERFQKGEILPPCKNLCGRGYWELVRNEEEDQTRAHAPDSGK